MPDNANQQTFVIHKEPAMTPFLQVNKELWKDVHKELKGGSAFSLWLWYSSNANGHRDNIYPTTIQKELGISKQSYYNARDKLIDYGYLIPDKARNYEYHFYEKTPIRENWRLKLKKDPIQENDLQNLYKDLVKQEKNIEDMTVEEWWLYYRGFKNKWQTDWSF